jgi:quinol monooxygenase YgiN
MAIAAPGIGQERGLMVRVAEVEVHEGFVDQYLEALREEARASVDLEPGVVSIFPMYEKEAPAKIRILEIYADRNAYEAHLRTPHFVKYKTTTLKMIKSLALVDMQSIDVSTMAKIFAKAGRAVVMPDISLERTRER